MIAQVAPAQSEVRDLEILIRAHHPIILLETNEEERAHVLVRWVADRMSLPCVSWTEEQGLTRDDIPSFQVEGSESPRACLDYVMTARTDTLYHLHGFAPQLAEPFIQQKLTAAAHRLFSSRSAIIITVDQLEVPRPLQRVVTSVRLSAPNREQYYTFIQHLLRDLHRRLPIEVKLSSDEVSRLLHQLQGLTLFEVKKILTKVVVEDHRLNADDIAKIAEAKKEIIARSGVLEYFSAEESMAEVAGLTQLKAWLGKRKLAFSDPERARQFGLTPPGGVLLVGVPGCGKSMCAKAVASEWQLPLIRFDPSSLYSKYFGETEKNLRRATDTAEAMAPVVLWIDEIEKALSQNKDDESGTSARIFGTFLSWLQDKKPGVFVIATSNDITRLPPELVRKGRFDEIFFVDLPRAEVREAVLAVHLRRRGRDPADFDLRSLSEQTEGFSGSEIEQVVLSSLYAAFSEQRPLTTEFLEEEIRRTVPLSVTAKEQLEELRRWAAARTVPA